jgi:hypothetical protein
MEPVREAEQRQMFKNLSARDWMQQTGEYATELFANVGPEVYRSILASMDEFAEAVLIDSLPRYADSLAEEAEQEAGEIKNYQEWIWSNVAAWLREKAR